MSLTVGMRGINAPISITVNAPPGVSWVATAPAITVNLVDPLGHVVTITDSQFTWVVTSAQVATASYVPDGTEIKAFPYYTVAAKVVAGGAPIDFVAAKVFVTQNTRVD